MKTKKISRWMVPFGALALLALGVGCSHGMGSKSGADIAPNGPTVVDARPNPSTFELSQALQPTQTAEILADVKDYTSKVTSVRLRFVRIPIEIPMEHVGGTTWRAQLSLDQLRTLAVAGQTMTYEANVIARNEDGQVAVSKEPVQVAVKTPDLSKKPA